MEKGFTPKSGGGGSNNIENQLDQKEVVRVIQSIDEKYRDVIIMKYIDGLSTKEIAAVTQEKENNVYIRLHRGLQKVRRILESREG